MNIDFLPFIASLISRNQPESYKQAFRRHASRWPRWPDWTDQDENRRDIVSGEKIWIDPMPQIAPRDLDRFQQLNDYLIRKQM